MLMQPRKIRPTNVYDSSTAAKVHPVKSSHSEKSLSMRTLFIIPLVLMSLVSVPCWGITMENDLVIRAGLLYEKFTATPFTGEVDEGLYRGSIKNGKMEGSWKGYSDNGQLFWKGNYKNGKIEGYWEQYNTDGTLWKEHTGTYKNGVKVSD